MQMMFSRAAAVAAIGGALVSAGVGLAGPASAEQLSGAYTATVTDGGGNIAPGATKTAVFTPCGPDCTNLVMDLAVADLRLQGDAWIGTYELPGVGTCTVTQDNNSLTLTEECASGQLVRHTLTPASQVPAVSVPDLPQNEQQAPPSEQPSEDQPFTGHYACVDGVRTFIPVEGLYLGTGQHDVKPDGLGFC